LIRGILKASERREIRLRLQSSGAKGLHRANYTLTDDRSKNWSLKPQEEWVYTPVEPIVAEALWERCNQILEARRASGKRTTRKTVHLLAGYAFCHCGEKMHVCRNKIPTADLEGEQLYGFVLSPRQIAAHVEAANETLVEREKLIASMEAELKKIEAEDDRIFYLYIEDRLTADDFGRRTSHWPSAATSSRTSCRGSRRSSTY
jgi:hypothetical protein